MNAAVHFRDLLVRFIQDYDMLQESTGVVESDLSDSESVADDDELGITVKLLECAQSLLGRTAPGESLEDNYRHVTKKGSTHSVQLH